MSGIVIVLFPIHFAAHLPVNTNSTLEKVHRTSRWYTLIHCVVSLAEVNNLFCDTQWNLVKMIKNQFDYHKYQFFGCANNGQDGVAIVGGKCSWLVLAKIFSKKTLFVLSPRSALLNL